MGCFCGCLHPCHVPRHPLRCTTLQVKDASGYEAGQQLNLVDMFKAGDMVDVAGTTIGKGFQGGGMAERVWCGSA